jgi:multidrug efflux pump subunit AcrA (membrane-fusion protein)
MSVTTSHQSLEEVIAATPDGEYIRKCPQCGAGSGICPFGFAMDYPPRSLIAALRAEDWRGVLESAPRTEVEPKRSTMKGAWTTVAVVFGVIAACGAWLLTPSSGRHIAAPHGNAASEGPSVPESSPGAISEVPGKTQPVPGRMGRIAPTVLHPVTRVLVSPGERVKAGQPLVKLDADEPEADVRAKRAALAELEAGLSRLKAMPREEERAEARATLEAAKVAAKAARQCHERFEGLRQKDAISLHQHQESHSALLRAEAEERAAAAHLQCLLKHPVGQEIAEMEARVAAAKAELEAAEAELEHYTVNAAIDGVVTRLEVYPGMVSRPGTSLWGEILDLREIDVGCEVLPLQADSVVLDQAVEVVQPGPTPRCFTGRVALVGRAADPLTGRVPVLVRIADTEERLRSNVAVVVRFVPSPTIGVRDHASSPPPSVTAR